MIEGLRKIAEKYPLIPLVDILYTLRNVDQCDETWDIMIEELAAYVLHTKLFDQLQQLVIQGPVYDGNVISKSDRDTLITMNLAERVMYKGEWGYTTATYRGGFVLKACFVSREMYDTYIKSKLQ